MGHVIIGKVEYSHDQRVQFFIDASSGTTRRLYDSEAEAWKAPVTKDAVKNAVPIHTIEGGRIVRTAISAFDTFYAEGDWVEYSFEVAYQGYLITPSDANSVSATLLLCINDEIHLAKEINRRFYGSDLIPYCEKRIGGNDILTFETVEGSYDASVSICHHCCARRIDEMLQTKEDR